MLVLLFLLFDILELRLDNFNICEFRDIDK